MAEKLPTYSELIARTDGPSGSSWNVFGAGDDIGTVNMLTPDRIRRAASLVRTGKTFNLDYAINAFSPPTAETRKNASHTIFAMHECIRDDYIDGLYLQSTSQVDGLRHAGHPSFGFYGGVKPGEVQVGTERLGVQRWAQRGIVGRGVLLDIERYMARQGTPLDHATGSTPFTADLLDKVAEASQVTFEHGDILMIHTGWCRYYFDDLSQDARAAIPHNQIMSCGIAQSTTTLEWLWDHQFAAVVSDTVAVEVRPTLPDSPFVNSFKGMMHQDLIGLLGYCLGELWRLDQLAADCASDGVFECMLVAKPLNIVGAVGSPPNALAIK
jgi:kynurenine formamidase